MSRFVVRLQVGEGAPKEYIRLGYTAHRIKREIERHYPEILVLEVYPL